MAHWVEELERLRRRQKPERRPHLHIPLPPPPRPPEKKDEERRERGVVIIGNDDDSKCGITISMF